MSSVPAAEVSDPTPIPISPRMRTIILIALAVVVLLVLRAVPSVLQLFLGASTLALLLSFPVGLLARFMRRGWAIVFTILTLNLLILLALVVVIPLLIQQLGALIAALPQYLSDLENSVHNLLQPLRDRGVLPAQPQELTGSLQHGFLDRSQDLLATVLADLLGFFANAIGGIVQGFVMLLIAIYLLADTQRIKASAIHLFPTHYGDDADELWTKLGLTVSRYIGGVVFSMAEQGALVALGALLLGIPYSALLGVWFGLTAVIPYLGAWLGAIPLVLIALFSGGIVKVALALGLTLLVNGFDSNIVLPRVQGKALQIHPIVIMLTVLGGAELAGPIGAVFALPIVGMLKVSLDFFIARVVVRAPSPLVVVTVPGRTADRSATLDGEANAILSPQQ